MPVSPTLAPLGSGADLGKDVLMGVVDMVPCLITRNLGQVLGGQGHPAPFLGETEFGCVKWLVF